MAKDLTQFYRDLEGAYELPVGILSAIEGSEASGDTAVSPKGARGRFQFMPATAQRFGLTNPDDPVQSAQAAAKYASFLDKTFGGDPALILAGYNAGEGAVQKYNGVPPYAETQNYVRRGLGILRNVVNSIIPAAEAETITSQQRYSGLQPAQSQPTPATVGATPATQEEISKYLNTDPATQEEVNRYLGRTETSQQQTETATGAVPATEEEIKKYLGPHSLTGEQSNAEQPVPGGQESFVQGVKSELLHAWQGLKQAGANAFSATMNPASAQGIPRSEVGTDVGTAAQQNADAVNAEAKAFIARQNQEDQPYKESHPWLYGGGRVVGSILETAPLILATPELPAVTWSGAAWKPALTSIGKRIAADAALGAGTGASLTPLQPQDVESADAYRQNLANALQGNMISGAIAGPAADVVASGAIGGIRGGARLLAGSSDDALSPAAREAIRQYNLYYGAGDITGSPILTKQETSLATNLPFTGIPGKYEKGVEAAKKAAESVSGKPASEAGTAVAEELVAQQGQRIAEQQGKVAALRDQFAPPAGVSADQGIRAGAIEQLDANKGVIRKAYDNIGNILKNKGLEETPIPVQKVQQAATALLDEMPKAIRDLAPPSLVKRLEAIRDMTENGGLTFNELRDLDKRVGLLYGQAKRAAGGVGDEFTRAYGNLKSAVVDSMDTWANSSGNRDVSRALSEAKKAHQELKLPYTKGANPAINKVIGTEEAEGSYGKLFNPKTPEQSGTNFNLLSQSGQKSAKYGLFSDILRKSEKGGQFDRDAFLAAARENKALASKMLSPSEQQAFGDVVDSIAKNEGAPAIEKSATAALAQDDPSVLMTKLMQNDNKVRYAMSRLSPDGRKAMGDYVLDKAVNDSVDPVTGELSLQKYSSYLAKNAEVLKQAGKWDSVKGLVEVFKATQRINRGNVIADPATGQRVVTAAGLGYAVANPFKAVTGLAVGRLLGGLLTNKTAIRLLEHIGKVSSKVAQSRMLSPDWQRQFSKVLQTTTAAQIAD